MFKKPSLIKRFIYRLFGLSNKLCLFTVDTNKASLSPVIDYFLVEDNFGNMTVAYGFSYFICETKKKNGVSEQTIAWYIDVSFCKAICPGTNRSASKMVNRISEEVEHTSCYDKGRMDIFTDFLGAKSIRVKEHILASDKFLSKTEILERQPACSAVARQQILNIR